jgi:hypothetical protein
MSNFQYIVLSRRRVGILPSSLCPYHLIPACTLFRRAGAFGIFSCLRRKDCLRSATAGRLRHHKEKNLSLYVYCEIILISPALCPVASIQFSAANPQPFIIISENHSATSPAPCAEGGARDAKKGTSLPAAAKRRQGTEPCPMLHALCPVLKMGRGTQKGDEGRNHAPCPLPCALCSVP